MDVETSYRKLDFRLYSELLFGKQERGMPTKSFVAQKRAIIGQMDCRFTEDHRIDMIYRMLALSINRQYHESPCQSFNPRSDQPPLEKRTPWPRCSITISLLWRRAGHYQENWAGSPYSGDQLGANDESVGEKGEEHPQEGSL